MLLLSLKILCLNALFFKLLVNFVYTFTVLAKYGQHRKPVLLGFYWLIYLIAVKSKDSRKLVKVS